MIIQGKFRAVMAYSGGHLIPPELTRDSLTSSWDSLFIYSPISTIEAEIVIRKLKIPVSPHHGVCDEVA